MKPTVRFERKFDDEIKAIVTPAIEALKTIITQIVEEQAKATKSAESILAFIKDGGTENDLIRHPTLVGKAAADLAIAWLAEDLTEARENPEADPIGSFSRYAAAWYEDAALGYQEEYLEPLEKFLAVLSNPPRSEF
jgi:hypothetical protein